MRPRLTGLPYLADRATRLSGLPHLSCKHDQIKMRDYMERRVTSPTWGSPPPFKQALIKTCNHQRATAISLWFHVAFDWLLYDGNCQNQNVLFPNDLNWAQHCGKPVWQDILFRNCMEVRFLKCPCDQKNHFLFSFRF